MGTTFTEYGKTIASDMDFEIMSEEQRKQLADEYREKPDFKEVSSAMYKIFNGDSNIKPITKYYFKDLMNDCIRHSAKFSVNQALDSVKILSYVCAHINRRSDYFKPEEGMSEALRMYFAMGGGGNAASVAQFPLKTIQYLLSKYNVNNNYYDFSCGWGCRLTGALSQNVNYYGTDPNYKLVEQLNKYVDDWRREIPMSTSSVNIYCQGSEFFIPELENKIGFAFSSTPYFQLEDYRYGNQSCRKDTYQEWVDEYLTPTIQNIYKYVIDGGYFLLNIKNYKNYTMEEDTVRIAQQVGFNYIDTEDLYLDRTFTRQVMDKRVSVSEPIFVFSKGDATLPKSKIDLW